MEFLIKIIPISPSFGCPYFCENTHKHLLTICCFFLAHYLNCIWIREQSPWFFCGHEECSNESVKGDGDDPSSFTVSIWEKTTLYRRLLWIKSLFTMGFVLPALARPCAAMQRIIIGLSFSVKNLTMEASHCVMMKNIYPKVPEPHIQRLAAMIT